MTTRNRTPDCVMCEMAEGIRAKIRDYECISDSCAAIRAMLIQAAGETLTAMGDHDPTATRSSTT